MKRLAQAIILLTIFVFVICLWLYVRSEGCKMEFSFSIPSIYKQLFSENVKSKLIVNRSFTINHKNWISSLTYNHQFSVEIYSVIDSSKAPLNKLLKEDIKGNFAKLPLEYGSFNAGPFEISLACYREEVKDSVIVSYYGDSLKPYVSNDSIAIFRINLRKVFVRYDNNGASDLMVRNTDLIYEKLPTVMIFKKKKDIFYIIFLSRLDGKFFEDGVIDSFVN
jgi:hypothetical protein